MDPKKDDKTPNNKRKWTGFISIVIWALILTILANYFFSSMNTRNTVFVYYTDFRAAVQADAVEFVEMSSSEFTFTLRSGWSMTEDGELTYQQPKAGAGTDNDRDAFPMSFADTKERCPWVKSPVPDYELTSLRGKIKRVQARLDELDKRAQQAEQPADSTKFPGGEIVRNLEADRLQILFDEKPDDETRQKLKERGFRWSPRYNAWQRKLTDNAMYDARRALGLTE